jgi:spore germination cell wall hydrolase CwlJ-like protein
MSLIPHLIVGILFAKILVSYMKGDNMRNLIIFIVGICGIFNTLHIGPLPKSIVLSKKQLTCLVDNAYHEAMGEGKVGRLLVTQVVLNRAHVKEESYCSIVYAHKQFSWTLAKRKHISPEIRKKLEYEIIELLHDIAEIPSDLKDATYFHTTSIKPYWVKTQQYLGTYKNHRFYSK